MALRRQSVNVEPSDIRVMSVECEKVKGINLAQGICDTDVPLPVRRAAIEAIEGGLNQYTRLDGIAPLRNEIARKMREYNGIECDPASEVIVTSGSTGGFFAACLALLQEGDEVIVFEPYYGYHVNTLRALKCTPVFVSMKAPDFGFSRSVLEQAVTPKTRAIIINTPGNPSGKIFSREELGWIAELAQKHDLLVISDEIYEYFLFDGAKHISPATLPGMFDRSITITGFSKTFSITGWRVGYAVCRKEFAQALAYHHDLLYICAPSVFQHAVTAGLRDLKEDFYSDLAAEYLRKRDMLCDALKESGLTPSIPQGAYYVLADSSELPGVNSKQKAMSLLQQTGVAAVPGESFFSDDSGRNLLRFCFAKRMPELEEACRRLVKLHQHAARV
jgi:aminotransferase